MIELSDKKMLGAFFNDNGYVLNFNDATFDSFTIDSVGIPIKAKYGLSKAKSLAAFINDCKDEKLIIKLIKDLVKYAELSGLKISEEKRFERLKEWLEDFKGIEFSEPIINTVKEHFGDSYINNQLEIMQDLLPKSSTDVIGKSKELVESCFKHILDLYGDSYSSGDNIITLRKKVFSRLNLDVKNIVAAKSNDDVKKILNSFNQIVDSLNGLRNEKGDGHGKGKGFEELPKRYAELAMYSALTIVNFVWGTYKDLNHAS